MSNNKRCNTHDGLEIDLFNPDPALFTVGRIAHTLARINRFGGRWVVPVSVARHSICVAAMLRDGEGESDGYDTETQLQGLFHDAQEAFTMDLPSPMKKFLCVEVPTAETWTLTGTEFVPYREFEGRLQQHVFTALEIEWPLHPDVHTTDAALTEQEKGWVWGEDSDLYRNCSTDPDVVAALFREHAERLFAERSHANDMPKGGYK